MVKFSFPINILSIFKYKSLPKDFFSKYHNCISSAFIPPHPLFGFNYHDPAGGNNLKNEYNNFFYKLSIKEYFNLITDLKNNDIEVNLLLNDIYSQLNKDRINRILYTYNDYWDQVTIPNKEYLYLKEFGFKLKNTVINIPTYKTVNNGSFDCYDIIQLHGDIIHNHDKWKSIKGNRKFSCLTSLGYCRNDCPKVRLHYKKISKGIDVDSFCPYYNETRISHMLKGLFCPPFKSEYDYYSDVIDEFKLCGRDWDVSFRQSIDIVRSYYDGTPMPESNYYYGIDELKDWLIQVRNCTGVCKNCHYCDSIINHHRYDYDITEINT